MFSVVQIISKQVYLSVNERFAVLLTDKIYSLLMLLKWSSISVASSQATPTCLSAVQLGEELFSSDKRGDLPYDFPLRADEAIDAVCQVDIPFLKSSSWQGETKEDFACKTILVRYFIDKNTQVILTSRYQDFLKLEIVYGRIFHFITLLQYWNKPWQKLFITELHSCRY
jgi:hypothetical protein